MAIMLPFAPRLGMVCLVLLFPFINRFIPRAGPGFNASSALFPLALLTGFLYSRPALPRLKVLSPFLAYYALTLVSYAILVASLDTKENAQVAIDAFQSLKARLWPTLLFFAGFALAPDKEMRRRLLLCLVVGLAVHSVSGIYDFATGGAGTDPLLGNPTQPGEMHRAAGVLDANPNHLGGHLGAFSILALMGLLDGRRPLWLRGACGGAYAISGMVLVLTQSRGSWLGFLVAHAVWLFYANRKLLLPVAAAGVVMGAALYSSSMLPESMSKRIESTLTPGHAQYERGGIGARFDSSVNARFAIHMTALEIFAHSPVWGHGYGSFPRLALEYGGKHGLWGMGLIASESIILNTAVEAGLIGLLVYGWLFWSMISPGRVLARGGEEKQLGIALLASFAAIFIESLTQIALYLPEVSLGLWLVAGMAARAVDETRHAPVPAPAQ